MTRELANREQAEYWNEKGGPKWVIHQETLDQQIEAHGLAMIDAANLAKGDTVLDVGCGCGATTLEIADRIGPDAIATGMDLSGPMLNHARKRAEVRELVNARFVQGDVQTSALKPDSCDAVTSRFGIMFFEDPPAAFRNLHQALREKGRLSFVCWRSPMENPWVALPMQAAMSLVELPPPPPPGSPGPFAFADRNRVEELLKTSGFRDISITPLDLTMQLGPSGSLDDAVAFIFEIGPLSRVAAELDDATKSKLASAIRKAIQPFHGDDGVSMPSAAWLVTARKS